MSHGIALIDSINSVVIQYSRERLPAAKLKPWNDVPVFSISKIFENFGIDISR